MDTDGNRCSQPQLEDEQVLHSKCSRSLLQPQTAAEYHSWSAAGQRETTAGSTSSCNRQPQLALTAPQQAVHDHRVFGCAGGRPEVDVPPAPHVLHAGCKGREQAGGNTHSIRTHDWQGGHVPSGEAELQSVCLSLSSRKQTLNSARNQAM